MLTFYHIYNFAETFKSKLQTNALLPLITSVSISQIHKTK